MLKYKNDGVITYFDTGCFNDNNVNKYTSNTSSTTVGKKRICVKYHNSTTSYGLTTDTTASEYSPKLRYSGSDIYFCKAEYGYTSSTQYSIYFMMKQGSATSVTYNYYKYIYAKTTDPTLEYDSNYCKSFTTTEKISVFTYTSYFDITSIEASTRTTSFTNSTIYSKGYSNPYLGNCCVIEPKNDIIYYINTDVIFDCCGRLIDKSISSNIIQDTSYFNITNILTGLIIGGPIIRYAQITGDAFYYGSTLSNIFYSNTFSITSTFTNLSQMLLSDYIYTKQSSFGSISTIYMPVNTKYIDFAYSKVTTTLTLGYNTEYASSTTYRSYLNSYFSTMYLSDVPEILSYEKSTENTYFVYDTYGNYKTYYVYHKIVYDITKTDFVVTKNKSIITQSSLPDITSETTNFYYKSTNIYNLKIINNSENIHTSYTTETIYTSANVTISYHKDQFEFSNYSKTSYSSTTGLKTTNINPMLLNPDVYYPYYNRIYIDDKNYKTTTFNFSDDYTTYLITDGQFKNYVGFLSYYDNRFTGIDSLTSIDNCSDVNNYFIQQGVIIDYDTDQKINICALPPIITLIESAYSTYSRSNSISPYSTGSYYSYYSNANIIKYKAYQNKNIYLDSNYKNFYIDDVFTNSNTTYSISFVSIGNYITSERDYVATKNSTTTIYRTNNYNSSSVLRYLYTYIIQNVENETTTISLITKNISNIESDIVTYYNNISFLNTNRHSSYVNYNNINV